jgi:hypothetical protein
MVGPVLSYLTGDRWNTSGVCRLEHLRCWSFASGFFDYDGGFLSDVEEKLPAGEIKWRSA